MLRNLAALIGETGRTERFVPGEEKGVRAVQPPLNSAALKLTSRLQEGREKGSCFGSGCELGWRDRSTALCRQMCLESLGNLIKCSEEKLCPCCSESGPFVEHFA